jgi:uncharacterized membrane protein
MFRPIILMKSKNQTNPKNLLITALILSIAGILFAGYLTISKLLIGICAFGESCPFLFGYPVCIYGLILFTTLTITIIALLLHKDDKLPDYAFLYTSILGVLFSGYYAFVEIFNPICGNNCIYRMGLPTCVYGFIVFTAVFVCMILYRKKA